MSTFLRIALAVMALLMAGVAGRAAARLVDPGQEFGLDVPAVPVATPVTVRAFGCPSCPCPTSLEFGVNGCTWAGDIYEASRVDAPFCCAGGYSYEECLETLQNVADMEAAFGATPEEVESHLVVVELQGWLVLVHERAASAFEDAARNLEGVDYTIREPIDGYFWGNVGGHQVLGPHAFGIAVDINPSTNPSCGVTQACRCYNDLITDMPPEFVQAFKDAGFDWGGDWIEHPDPMHFEWSGWR